MATFWYRNFFWDFSIENARRAGGFMQWHFSENKHFLTLSILDMIWIKNIKIFYSNENIKFDFGTGKQFCKKSKRTENEE